IGGVAATTDNPVVHTLAEGGVVTLYADGSYSYAANGASAPDSFTWTVTDTAGLSSEATVTVSVGEGNPDHYGTLDDSIARHNGYGSLSADKLTYTGSGSEGQATYSIIWYDQWLEGKSYWETEIVADTDNGRAGSGLVASNFAEGQYGSMVSGGLTGDYAGVGAGGFYVKGSLVYAIQADDAAPFGDGAVYRYAYDAESGELRFGVGDSWWNNGEPVVTLDKDLDWAPSLVAQSSNDSITLKIANDDWSYGAPLGYAPGSLMEGTDGNDVLTGNEGTVTIDGGAGDDLLLAGDVTPDELVTVGAGAAFQAVNSHSGFSFSEDGQTVSMGTGFAGSAIADIEMSSGQFYWEVKFTNVAHENGHYWHEGTVGIANQAFGINDQAPQGNAWVIRGESGAVVEDYKADAYMDGVWHPEFGSEIGENDVLGVAFDATAGTIEFFLNGESMKKFSGIPEGSYNPIVSRHNTAASRPATFEFNFGQDGFAHEAPSGFHSVYAVPDTNAGATLSGGSGDDTLIGGAGDDTLVGGSGEDVARYAGTKDDYTITNNGDGTYSVTNNANSNADDIGTDILSGIEKIHFDANENGVIDEDSDPDDANDDGEIVIDLTKESGPVGGDAKVVLDGWETVTHKLTVSDADLNKTGVTESLSYEVVGVTAVDGIYTLASGATVSFDEEGNYTYTPAVSNQPAVDSFTWRATDLSGMSTEEGTINLQGAPVPYDIGQSVVFDGTGQTLTQTLVTEGNRKTWTFSTWVRRGDLNRNQTLFSGGTNATNDQTAISIGYGGSNEIFLHGPTGMSLRSQALLDQTGEWYHLVVAMDTTQATASDRVKIYLDGTQLDSFTNPTYPALNAEMGIGKAGGHAIGRFFDFDLNHINGDLADVAYVDGQALDANAFGQSDGNGGWVAGGDGVANYGSNGFRFDFADSGNLGKDLSGNGNDYTVNGTLSQGTDVPAVGQEAPSYAGTDGNDVFVGNDNTITIDGGAGDDLIQAGDVNGVVVSNDPAEMDAATKSAGITLSEGDLRVGGTGGVALSNQLVKGPVYFEVEIGAYGAGIYAGFASDRLNSVTADFGANAQAGAWYTYSNANGTTWMDDGGLGPTGTNAYKFSPGQRMLFAYDPETGKAWIGKGGLGWYDDHQNVTGDPATGANPTFVIPEADRDSIRVMLGARSGGTTTLDLKTASGDWNYGAPDGFDALAVIETVDGATLAGGSGDDTLIGGNGDDTLVGGSGEDIARYAGAMSGYTVTNNGDGTYSVSKDGIGTDTLAGIEKIHFDANDDGIINVD
ncbi:Ig-like domain-containing protein, partial [Aestuariispira insulae]|uniref:Ig-like domain-containing protein n=1 Tax=Aestuariispira insulae TaxID=1461337 RepID=UPI000E282C82